MKNVSHLYNHMQRDTMKLKKSKNKNHVIDTLLTVKEVVTRLQVSRVTLHKLTTEGKVKSVRIGRLVRYKTSEIDSFINNQ